MENKAEVIITVGVDCPIKSACPHVKMPSPLLAPRWQLENARERIAELEAEIKNREAETQKGNRCCASCEKKFNERIEELESRLDTSEQLRITAVDSYIDKKKRIEQIAAERDAAMRERDKANGVIENIRSDWRDHTMRANALHARLLNEANDAHVKLIKERDTLKRDLENVMTNYEDYRMVCDERDALRARIDAAVKIINKIKGNNLWYNMGHVRDALSGNPAPATESSVTCRACGHARPAIVNPDPALFD